MTSETQLDSARRLIVDRSSPVPLYFQVATHLEQLIETNVIPVGTRFENEVDLAERLGVSRPTMRRAMQYLVERDVVVRRRGVGTQVVQPVVRRAREPSSLYDDLAKAGRAPSTVVRRFVSLPASPAIAEQLRVTEGDDIYHIERIRYADGEPLAILVNAIPCSVATLQREDLETHGLYDQLRAAGSEPRFATQVIGARVATAPDARLLNERRGAALLTMTRTAFDEMGRVVDYGNHVYRADRYTFELSLSGS
jgi:DNA-binding GntR family transcriptional regulator